MSRKKLTYILRPSLPRRAIVWFPPFETLERIEHFRRQHDPLATRLPAHLTLVFPFHSRLTLEQLSAHTQRVLRAWPPFPVVLTGLWSVQNRFVGLATQVGASALVEMHDRLYRGPLAEFLRPEFDYEPHLTLARADDDVAFDTLSRSASLLAQGSHRALLRQLSIIREQPDQHWQVEKTLDLNLA